MKNTVFWVALLLGFTAVGQSVKVSPWTSTTDPAAARAGLGITPSTSGAIGSGIALLSEPQKWSSPIHVLETAGWGSDTGVQEPAVFVVSNVLRMIYAGMSTNTQLTYLGYAESADGTNWTSPYAVPVIGNNHGGQVNQAFHHFVYQLGGTNYCYFTTNSSGLANTLVATSVDASNWTTVAVAYTNLWTMANTCVVSNDADGLYYMAVEYHIGNTNWVTGMATSSVPVGPFRDLRPIDPTLDFGLGGYSVGSIRKINGVWQNWYHVQPSLTSLPSSVVRASTASAFLTNWTTAPNSPVFVTAGQTTHGYASDQVADAKSLLELNGTSYLWFDTVHNANPNNVVGSILLSTYSGYLSNAITDGNFPISRPITANLAANTLINNNAASNLLFTVVDNVGTLYNPNTGEFVITAPGLYHVSASAGFSDALSGSGAEQLRLLVNGTLRFLNSYPALASPPQMNLECAVRCVKGDKLIVAVFQNNGSAKNIAGLSGVLSQTYTEVRLIGP